MPPQHVEVAETIAALKRALRREKEAPTNHTISAATNRGHKLARGANYVHAGALPYAHGPESHKQKIEHAGYTRYILQHNPIRTNEDGDELEDDESDAEADADAEEENPYAGIRLEELLCPLKHPSELATHPTLSLPFLDPALPDMVRSTEDKLRQERANLWRAKNLSRQFMGDESWMPLESTEGIDDWDMFEPKPRIPAQQAGKKRKRDFENGISQNGINGHDYAASAEDQDAAEPAVVDLVTKPDENGRLTVEKLSNTDSEPASAPEQPLDQDEGPRGDQPIANGFHKDSDAPVEEDDQPDKQGNTTEALDPPANPDAEGNEQEQTDEAASESEIQTQPTRRITRAFAAENNNSNTASPPLSPNSTVSSIDSYLLQTDPLFLLPPILAANHRAPRSLLRLGIPVDELMDTRRLLTMYIQKQEESVRGYEAMLGKLIKAKRMRDKVWQWAKTEGHVGEWSDGEDWIDAEAWGLQLEDLKKGTDEENNEAQEDTGRKGKRRRRD
ncbi:hypothetical protein H2200_008611 [Cladophialophora chaetospira]|uniref:Transcriptional regulatory protein RXT2 N-terminal domain-containing protein n=1 Tax=Cladophialophora chaetospira TaxID=386627 RepID=A0AA38X4E5_9EURO|nr:hypothetical protein H2200_008611 [Cladophialophora chaetospira]